MASAPFDWTPVEKGSVKNREGGRDPWPPSLALISPCPTQSRGQEDRPRV